jgi:hypothetical protein
MTRVLPSLFVCVLGGLLLWRNLVAHINGLAGGAVSNVFVRDRLVVVATGVALGRGFITSVITACEVAAVVDILPAKAGTLKLALGSSARLATCSIFLGLCREELGPFLGTAFLLGLAFRQMGLELLRALLQMLDRVLAQLGSLGGRGPPLPPPWTGNCVPSLPPS